MNDSIFERVQIIKRDLNRFISTALTAKIVCQEMFYHFNLRSQQNYFVEKIFSF